MSDGKSGVSPAYPGDAPIQEYQVQQQTVILRQSQPMPNDYMAVAILVTFCCCLPLGIVAIIKSSEVRSRYAAGDYDGAQDASKEAKKWSIAGCVTGGILLLVVLVFYIIIIVATAAYSLS